MLTLLTLLTAPANAWMTMGNPTLHLKIARSEGDLTGGLADLEGVRVHKCSGGYNDYTANVTIDPTNGWSTQINGGDLCMVEVFWNNTTFVWSDDFELKSNVSSHNVKISNEVNTTTWTPFTVTDGTFWGSKPEVMIAFD